MVPDQGLRRSATMLALSSGVEYGLQLAMPIILVRCLDETTFSQYRLLWLMAATAMAIAPAFMPQSLFYFLGRAESGQKGLWIGNVLIYLLATGALVGVLAVGWNPWLQNAARNLFFETHGMSAGFLALWVVASMLDVLPTADGKVRWQAHSTIGLAVLRTLLLASAAIVSRNIAWISFAMLMVAGTKLLLLFYYVKTNGEVLKFDWHMMALKKQLIYSLPFAIGNGLFLLRVQADQWVVVTMLSSVMYAAFSNASIALPIATLLRQPIHNATMSRLNNAHARKDTTEVARLIAKSNGTTSFLLIPVTGGLFVAAPELVQLIFTNRYMQTVPIMQVYLVGMMMDIFSVGYVLPVLGQGYFAAKNSAVCLVLSIAISIIGVLYCGLIGAAFGSVATFALGELWSLNVVAHTLGIRVNQLLAWPILCSAFLGTCFSVLGVFAIAPVFGSQSVVVILLAKGLIFISFFAPCFVLLGGRKQLQHLMR